MEKHDRTRVTVSITLRNGTTHTTTWLTPYSLRRAITAAQRWARDDLRERKVPGRSSILAYSVNARGIAP